MTLRRNWFQTYSFILLDAIEADYVSCYFLLNWPILALLTLLQVCVVL